MSLLLDALKKAEEDKQQKEEEEAAPINGDKDDFNLLLPESTASIEKKDKDTPMDPVDGIDKELVQLQKEDQEQYSVSKEALDLLIHKTNANYRKKKIIWTFLVILLSLTILATGGMYFMQAMYGEVALLEEKHVQALSLLKKRTKQEKLPRKTKIIKSLISDASLEEKVAFAQKTFDKTTLHDSNIPIKKTTSPKFQAQVKKQAKVLAIEKTNKEDPISIVLEKAWVKYDNGNFSEANDLYKEVLMLEPRNRDALYGLGIISSLTGNDEMSKEYYSQILQKAPNDEEAIAALVNLYGVDDEAEDYLKDLLLKNKRSALLNYSLGNIYAQKNKWKAAQAVYFNAWSNDDRNLIYAYNLAISLDQLGQKSQAIKFYKMSIELSKHERDYSIRQQASIRLKQLGVVINELGKTSL